jgi:hypothetical protein
VLSTIPPTTRNTHPACPGPAAVEVGCPSPPYPTVTELAPGSSASVSESRSIRQRYPPPSSVVDATIHLPARPGVAFGSSWCGAQLNAANAIPRNSTIRQGTLAARARIVLKRFATDERFTRAEGQRVGRCASRVRRALPPQPTRRRTTSLRQ